MSIKWRFEMIADDDYNPYTLYELDENQHPIRYSGRSFCTEEELIHIGQGLNNAGANVIGFKEIFCCTARGE